MFLALVLKEDPSPKYDVICTSGTIYNTAYNSALHNTLQTVGLGVNGLPGHQGQLLWGGCCTCLNSLWRTRECFDMEKLWNVDQGLQRHVVVMRFKAEDHWFEPSMGQSDSEGN